MDENQTPSPNLDQFAQIVERLKSAQNVLVTVRSNPSIDQLAACIGLTLLLNKEGKHATAVFSGDVPSTIGFLEPEKTLEKNTDSLRDFIISLDKSKADKLRYKVEDDVVKIFITPYKTSITDQDLDFSQGDFNVDAVVALGVHDRGELDQAIVAHGRILHDATVISVNFEPGPELGSINWTDPGASSLCEMASDLASAVGKKSIDQQIATAFLTGIVAETDRFRNEKSSPHTMTIAGTLMSAGASTQLVSSKLEEPVEPSSDIPDVIEDDDTSVDTDEPHADGMIEISHEPEDDIHIDDHTGDLKQMADVLLEQEAQAPDASQPEPEPSVGPPQPSGMILEPPTLGGQLTANSVPEHQQYEGTSDPLSGGVDPGNGSTLSHSPVEPAAASQPEPAPEQPAEPAKDQTLSDIERTLQSPHVSQYAAPASAEPAPADDVPPPPDPDYARDAVERAVAATADYRPEPVQSLGAQEFGAAINPGLQFEENDDSNTTPPPPVPPPLPPQA